jgi:hypothetical protein
MANSCGPLRTISSVVFSESEGNRKMQQAIQSCGCVCSRTFPSSSSLHWRAIASDESRISARVYIRASWPTTSTLSRSRLAHLPPSLTSRHQCIPRTRAHTLDIPRQTVEVLQLNVIPIVVFVAVQIDQLAWVWLLRLRLSKWLSQHPTAPLCILLSKKVPQHRINPHCLLRSPLFFPPGRRSHKRFDPPSPT